MPMHEAVRETLRRYADAWEAGDLEAMLDSYADDVVFHYFGATDLAGDHVGKEACVTAMVTASVRAARELLEVVDVLAGDRLGALVVRERLTRAGESVDLQRVLVYRIEESKLAEVWLHDEDQALVDRLWAP
jgi:hypothetical protein